MKPASFKITHYYLAVAWFALLFLGGLALLGWWWYLVYVNWDDYFKTRHPLVPTTVIFSILYLAAGSIWSGIQIEREIDRRKA